MKREESFLTNLTKLYVLILLYERPMHGYELIIQFEHRLNKRLSPGQIYPLLNNMKNKGLVSVEVEYQGNRKRKVYSLTAKGERLSLNLLSTLKSILSIVK